MSVCVEVITPSGVFDLISRRLTGAVMTSVFRHIVFMRTAEQKEAVSVQKSFLSFHALYMVAAATNAAAGALQ